MINKAILTVTLLIVSGATASVQAQTAAVKPDSQGFQEIGNTETGRSTNTPPKGGTTNTQDTNTRDAAQVVQTYRTSLKNLAASYQADLKKLSDRNSELKQMLAQGYVSRLEVEQSDKVIAEAQARLDETRKRIAEADAAVTEDQTDNIIGTSQHWATGNAKIDALIRHYAASYAVDPYLVYCVMRQESGFDSSRVSPKGARGLMQLMPDTAARYGVVNLFDPGQNIMAGTHYLSDLLKQFNGNVTLALAGYNAGEGAVMKYGNTVPPYPETIDYVRNITTRYSPKYKSLPAVKKRASGH